VCMCVCVCVYVCVCITFRIGELSKHCAFNVEVGIVIANVLIDERERERERAIVCV